MSQQHGFVAYRAYRDSFGGKTREGKPRPHWDDLSELTRKAWAAAAEAVLADAKAKP